MSFADAVVGGMTGLAERIAEPIREHVVKPMQEGLQTFSNVTQNVLGQSAEGFVRTLGGKLGITDKGQLASLETMSPEHALKGNMALPLAKDAYNDTGAPEGWTRLEPDLGVPMNDNKTGFAATLYENEAGEVALAFRGSEPKGNDWFNNLRQGLHDTPPQYDQALSVARAAKETYGDRLVAITGHSLGGGLATAAGLDTGTETFAFNAAGLSDHTRAEIGEGRISENSDKVANFNNAGDPLSDTNGLRDPETWGGLQEGQVYWFPSGREDNLLERHGMDNQEAILGQLAEHFKAQ